MTSNPQLKHLLEERRALSRRMARLEAVIAVEMMHSKDMASWRAHVPAERDTLSWEDALHKAKVRWPGDVLALQD